MYVKVKHFYVKDGWHPSPMLKSAEMMHLGFKSHGLHCQGLFLARVMERLSALTRRHCLLNLPKRAALAEDVAPEDSARETHVPSPKTVLPIVWPNTWHHKTLLWDLRSHNTVLLTVCHRR